MTDNKIQSATCHGRCGRCRLESHTRGKGGRRGGASMGLWLLPSRGLPAKNKNWSARVTHLAQNAVHSAP